MELKILKIDGCNEPLENMSHFIHDFSKVANIIDVQYKFLNKFSVVRDEDTKYLESNEEDYDLYAFINYEDTKTIDDEALLELKKTLSKGIDLKTLTITDNKFFETGNKYVGFSSGEEIGDGYEYDFCDILCSRGIYCTPHQIKVALGL